MTPKSFEELIVRLEAYARRQPGAYKLELAFLAVLGYTYFVVTIAALAGVLSLAAAYVFRPACALPVAAGVVLLGIIWTFVWWSRIEFDPPNGYSLVETEAPKLYAMIDELRRSLRAPRLDHVVLTDELNASVAQVPRMGILGRPVNYLVIGLPLMQALSAEQFRAVLAHEIAHLSRNHSRFCSWIARVRQTWITVLENLNEPARGGGFVLRGFLRWYAPYFSAYSFVLARSNEYVADRCAADVVGARALADALVATRLKASFVENQFWPDVFDRAICDAHPPGAPHATMFHALPAAPYGQEAERWFEEALLERTTFADTHPSLASRLAALGFRGTQISPDPNVPPAPPLPMPPPVGVTAADHYLGRLVVFFTRHFDAAWQQQVASDWQERHEEAREDQHILDCLEQKAAYGGLTDEERWTLFQLTSRYRCESAAVDVLKCILAEAPSEPRANYALGQILLKKDDPHGIDNMERAMAVAPDCTIPACEAVYFFLKRTGQFSAAVEYRRRSDSCHEMLLEAQEERSTVSASDGFALSDLSLEHIQPLRERLARYPEVRSAYLVRKVCRVLPEKPFYILGIVPRSTILQPKRFAEQQDIAEDLAVSLTLPGEARLVLLAGRYYRLRKVLARLPGSLIYSA
ncbi:MAG: M48 family metallopeptidase [Capsulimonadaceae bacterium]